MMWFITAGLTISVLGWAYLLFGVSVEATGSLFARPDVTAHTLSIITSVINFGYALCIFGAVWPEVRMRLKAGSEASSEPAVATKAGATKSSAKTPDTRASAQAQQAAPHQQQDYGGSDGVDWSRVEQEFLKTFGVQARITNGRVILQKGRRRLEFETVDVAWEYCLTHLYDPKQR
jgi:hypothetical protein